MTKNQILLVIILCILSCALGALTVKFSPPPKATTSTSPAGVGGLLPEDTLELQKFLNTEGYEGKDGLVLTLDGRMGPNTEYARDRYICDMHGAEAYRKALLEEE